MSTATLLLHSPHSKKETRQILNEALHTQQNFAYARFLKFAEECQQFETLYQMASDRFLEQFEAGKLGDDIQWFDWYAAYRGKLLWEKKYTILHDLSWNG